MDAVNGSSLKFPFQRSHEAMRSRVKGPLRKEASVKRLPAVSAELRERHNSREGKD